MTAFYCMLIVACLPPVFFIIASLCKPHTEGDAWMVFISCLLLLGIMLPAHTVSKQLEKLGANPPAEAKP